jgi:RNA polymerase sigma-32 factor
VNGNATPARPEDELGRLLDQARRHPMLGAEEERGLALRWRDRRDPEAARRLAASHLRLVVRMARGYAGYGLPLGDLVAEGNLGLVRALARFDPERGFRFSTYAMWWIKAAMQEHVLHNRSLVKLGTTAAQKKLFFRLRRLKARLGETGGGDLPAEAVASIARELGVREDEVVGMDRRLAAGDASLNARVGEDGDREWQDALVDEGQDQEDRVAEASELAWRRALLAGALGVLDPRERRIVDERRLREEPATLEDLARVYGVSRERIRQVEVRALEKLREAVLAAAAANDAGGRPALAA